MFSQSPLVTLHLVDTQACSSNNLTFLCESSGNKLLVWSITALPGDNGAHDAFGQTLNNGAQRIFSSDMSLGPNPTSITILNATADDNGARVQCHIVNGASSEEITLSIRKGMKHTCAINLCPFVCELNVDCDISFESFWQL